jgi:hypothetical protein
MQALFDYLEGWETLEKLGWEKTMMCTKWCRGTELDRTSTCKLPEVGSGMTPVRLALAKHHCPTPPGHRWVSGTCRFRNRIRNFAVVFWLPNPITSVQVGLVLTETKERNMSDENGNEKEKGKEVQEGSPKANQLSGQELKKVSGGWGDITSPDKGHKDWSE